MEKSRSQSSDRDRDERRRRDQEERRKQEQAAAVPERGAELAIGRHGEVQNALSRGPQARAARQQRVARAAGQLAVQQTLARQQQAARVAGQMATRAAASEQP
jgi:hypothetical protein